MDIPERNNLLKDLEAFGNSNFGDTEGNALFNSLQIYIDCLIGYCARELKGKPYSFDHVIPQLFELKFDKEQQWKQHLRCSLYALQQYLECLKKYKLHRENVKQYRGLILMLTSDAEWLLAHYEHACKNSADNIRLSIGANRKLSTRDLVFSMNELFFIDDCDDLASFDMRDIKPNFMFIVRQMLETLGNQLIGFRQIVEENGHPIHKLTQISWDFLSQSANAKQNITMPCQISSIHKVSKWANSFVHSRHLYASYIQFYALDFINHLMSAPSSAVTCYDGKQRISTLFGDFKIEHYITLRTEFENFVNKQHPKAKVEWLPLKDAGAYILSLG